MSYALQYVISKYKRIRKAIKNNLIFLVILILYSENGFISSKRHNNYIAFLFMRKCFTSLAFYFEFKLVEMFFAT